MGPNNPWSPDWRPDTTGRRLATIRTMRAGAVAAAFVYAIVGMGAAFVSFAQLGMIQASSRWTVDGGAAAVAIAAVGLPGVALLGAGLAPTTIGSRIDAAVAGLAFGIGAPVAAVTSVVIAGFVIGAIVRHDLTAMLVRTGVGTALAMSPAVVIGAAVWVVIVRRLGQRSLGSG